MNTVHTPLRLALVLLLALAAATAGAQPGNKTPAAPRATWMTVGDATLESMRGGFDLGGGLMVSFGISRAITVNGVLLAATTFNIPDVARITAVQAAALERQMNSTSLVQVGPNNSVVAASSVAGAAAGAAAAPASMPAAATVVQNTLDNQLIQTRTLIDTTTNAMSLAKSINAAGALRDALLRGR
ncbi:MULTISPECIES: hypothetical protein [unclassified Variovorax]|uniref:hypothetical protein n=1 Tax=unclassified Variovorax TaxID=663243 RepID=UPI002578E9FB|nr:MULTISPECIES: hypothetical protein [unclassified Variovorax]MDM0085932.1 hypothetical protein [Variovorax sp. J22G40]MDM0145811.1 hypothetical protein [Variovorax sp. J2P1-31]